MSLKNKVGVARQNLMNRIKSPYLPQVVQRLGGGKYEVDTRITSKTTHLVCYEKKRNMNMLRSVIRGIWVLDYEWIVKSDALGSWQREEAYEVTIFGNTLTVSSPFFVHVT